MEIKLGYTVVSEDGKLGDISRLVVDPKSDTVDELVVKHGLLLSQERVVPMKYVQRVEDGTVYVAMKEQDFGAMDGYTEANYRASDPDELGPPGFDREGRVQTSTEGDLAANLGSLPDEGSTPFGFPGGESIVPDDQRTPVIEPGTKVVDAYGEKVGEVGNFSFDVASMKPTGIHLRRGSLFGRDVEVPGEWVQELAYKAIVLNVPKERVDALGERSDQK